MPGIVGLITKMPPERAQSELSLMLGTMCHERFYGTGTWADERSGLYLAWVGRDEAASTMAVTNSRGDLLVLSGEEFPHTTACSTRSARLARYVDGDPAFPACVNGRFQGVISDRATRSARLFTDRYGLHRLYYHQSADTFYFAAEAKAILAVRPELRAIDPRSLGELVACGCVLEDRSIFSGIGVLPPAAVWTLRAGGIDRKGTYFRSSEWEQQTPLAPEEYYRQLRDVFSRTLPTYLESQAGIGMSLTGGLDSRMIMAWQGKAGSLRCYSFGSMFRDCRDVRLARAVARACGQSHEVISLGPDFLSRFAHYAERTVYLTDGCVEVNHSPDLFANERARAIAPVRLTGNYGGEVLRGVRAFKPVQPTTGLFQPELMAHVNAAHATYAGIVGGHPVSFAVFRQAPLHHYGLLALEETQLALRSPYLDNDFVRVAFRAPRSAFTSNEICLRLIADGNSALRRIPTDRGVGSDSVGSALSRRWLELTFKAEYAFDYGMPQWAAMIDHRLAALHLERFFLGRHKFYHFRIWYRDALSSYVKDMLLDPLTRSRPYIQGRTLERMVHSHVKGDRNYTSEIHKVLTLELIHRLLIERRVEPERRIGRPLAAETVTSTH